MDREQEIRYTQILASTQGSHFWVKTVGTGVINSLPISVLSGFMSKDYEILDGAPEVAPVKEHTDKTLDDLLPEVTPVDSEITGAKPKGKRKSKVESL